MDENSLAMILSIAYSLVVSKSTGISAAVMRVYLDLHVCMCMYMYR